MKETQYAVYRGDEFVDVGTAEELAKKHGVKPSSIKCMATPSYRKRIGENALSFYRLEDGE